MKWLLTSGLLGKNYKHYSLVQLILLLTISLLVSAYSPQLLAHAEHDKPRYVSTVGADSGKCDQLSAPCSSVNYAALQSNKGDRILMAPGSYVIDDVNTLFYLVSDLVPVDPQHQRGAEVVSTNPDNITQLVGVPLEFAEKLRAKGFAVIVDSKGIEAEKTRAMREKMQVYDRLKEPKVALNCDNGFSGDHPCSNLDLLSHIPLSSFSVNPSAANDIWGFYDINDGKEYAIIGLRNGVGVVEVTQPENPRMVGSVASQSTTWRDIKVFQHYDIESAQWSSYAYVTADNAAVGTMVLDLRQLPESISILTTDTSDVSAHNVYLSNVDYSLGVALNDVQPYLHIAGSNREGGAFNTFSLVDPQSLTSVYRNSSSFGSNYSHDVSSMVIRDERKDTQCVNAGPLCEVFFDFNEDNFQIWDKTDNSAPSRLSSTSYDNVSYVHSGWYTEDHQTVIVHDELDESNYGLNTTVRFFELSDLRSPSLLSTWFGPTGAIDHNGFVRGNRYYMSNYTRGMTVLDISDVTNPVEAGFFDTFPLTDNTSFDGAWGVYPYLPSGVILVSDISSGLYVLRDNTLSPEQGSVSFSAPTYSADEGAFVAVEVERLNGVESQVSVSWEIIAGNADSNDVSINSGELSWDSGENSSKALNIPIKTDSLPESKESFFVRLFDPRNGLALKSPSLAIITIAANDAAPSVSAADITVTAGLGVAIDLQIQGFEDASTSIQWQQLSGDVVEFTVGDAGQLGFVAPDTAGQLEFQVTVTDASGFLASDTVLITVVANEAPSVDAGSDLTVDVGSAVTLEGSASDSDGGTLTYSWQQLSGQSVTIDQADQLTLQFTAPSVAGDLQFEFSVADSLGASASDSVDVTVVAPPPAPVPTQQPSGGGGGGGCVVAEGGRDSSLLLLLLLVSLVSLRRHPRLRGTNTSGASVR